MDVFALRSLQAPRAARILRLASTLAVAFLSAFLGAAAIAFGSLDLHAAPAEKPEVVIAAAANLTDAFQALGSTFEAKTGIHPVFSFGSTALLTQQAENSAPFDVFAAADAEHVEELDQKGLLAPGSRVIYATGALALWIPDPETTAVRSIHDLTKSDVRLIAVANPKLAPYGSAAIEALKKSGVWDQVSPKIVYAENINMARQYGASGNADAVFTAYPLVFREKGSVLRVDQSLYSPLRQAVGILAHPPHLSAAQSFVRYLLSDDGRNVLKQFGYQLPARVTDPLH